MPPPLGVPSRKSANPKPPLRVACTGFGPCVKVLPKLNVPDGCVFCPSLKSSTRQSAPALKLCDPRENATLPRVLKELRG